MDVWTNGVCRSRSLQCYNSYQDSQHIGGLSHYTCPHACVPWIDMCQGVSWCEGDHEVCGPDLRCPPNFFEGPLLHNVTKYNFTSSLFPDHHYCLEDVRINNGIYDSIDRSDESEVQNDGFTLDLDISSFTSCNDSNDPGVMCGSECLSSDCWCYDISMCGDEEDNIHTCDTESGEIWTNDSRLCSNPLLWRDVSCS